MKLDQLISKEFKLDPDILYLNHAAVAPWPQRTQHAVEAFAAENTHQGAKDYTHWIQKETQLRQQLATLINAPHKDDIALLKNTSEALSVVAHGIDWRPGDNVVISDQEFPSNRIVWESLKQHGVEVYQVDLSSAATPEAALISATNTNTRLLAISSVQYSSGLRMDLETLGEYCHKHHILFCVDAIQSIGALVTDVQAIQADFMMADGHKWMLSAEGLALFYCRAEIREQLQLHQYGWHMVEQHNDYEAKQWDVAKSARRFECGSSNMLGVHAMLASTSLLLEIGMQTIEQQILNNGRILFDLIAASDHLSPLTSTDQGRYSGIVCFRHKYKENSQLYRFLLQHGVICAQRGRGIRYSPHFYTSLTILEQAIKWADYQ